MRYFRALIIVTCIVILLGILGASTYQPRKRTPSTTLAQQAQTGASPTPIATGGYSVFSQKIRPDTLTLIPNFTEAKTSSELIDEHGCTYGANGGYYTTVNKPLGLFITGRAQLGATTTSSAANAFLSKYPNGTLALSQIPPPADAVEFALQAGPHLIPGITPRITSDEHARRVLIANTSNNEWYFLVITHRENAYDGPLLSEIPSLLAKLPQNVTEALNLDGGTASAFYSEDGARFGELTMVGSFFCGK